MAEVSIADANIPFVPFVSQSQTPNPPGAGKVSVFSSTDGKFYIIDSSSVITPLGSGSSPSGKIYANRILR